MGVLRMCGKSSYSDKGIQIYSNVVGEIDGYNYFIEIKLLGFMVGQWWYKL